MKLTATVFLIASTLGCAEDRVRASEADLQAPAGSTIFPPPEVDGGVVAQFRGPGSLPDEFVAHITTPKAIDQAIAQWRRTARPAFPVGKVLCGPIVWNEPWTWHLDPATVRFAEVTVEVCHATATYIEQHCATWPHSFCAAGYKMIDLLDCRDPSVGCVPLAP